MNYYEEFRVEGPRTPTNYNLAVQFLFPLKPWALRKFIVGAIRARDWMNIRIALAITFVKIFYNKKPLPGAPYWIRKLCLDERGGNFREMKESKWELGFDE